MEMIAKLRRDWGRSTREPEAYVWRRLRRIHWMSIAVFTLVIAIERSVIAQTAPDIVEIETTTGEVIRGIVVESDADGIVLDLPYGLLSIPASLVKRIERQEEPGPEETKKVVWSSNIEGSLLTRQGIETEVSARIAGGTSRTTETSRTRLNGEYIFINSTERKDSNRGKAQLRQDWLDPNSPWSEFGMGIYDYDGFKSWVRRVSAYAGVGYDLFNREKLLLIARLGGGARKDLRGQEDFDAEALVNVEFVWQIGEYQRVNLDNSFYQNVSNTSKYRNYISTAYTIQVGMVKGLFVSVGADYEYDSRPDVEDDVKVYTSLRWEF